MPTEWHMWVCSDLLLGGFEKSLPRLESTLPSGSEQMPAIFSHAPILTWLRTPVRNIWHLMHEEANISIGEFGNSEDRTFSCWVRPGVSVYPCLPDLPPACWVHVFLNLPPGHKSSQLIRYVVFPDSSALNIFVCISMCSVHPSEGPVVECIWFWVYWILHLIQFIRHLTCNGPLQDRMQWFSPFFQSDGLVEEIKSIKIPRI